MPYCILWKGWALERGGAVGLRRVFLQLNSQFWSMSLLRVFLVVLVVFIKGSFVSTFIPFGYVSVK